MKKKINTPARLLGIVIISSIIFCSCINNDGNSGSDIIVGDSSNAEALLDTSMTDNTLTDNTATPNAAKKGLKGKISTVNPEMPPKPDAKMVADESGIYPIVDIMASFPGGYKGLQNYFDTKMEYPLEANNAGVEGTVRVTFIVDENGKLIDPTVVGNRPGYGLEEEALNIVKRMPDWYPAQVKDKKVKTRITLPIRFELN